MHILNFMGKHFGRSPFYNMVFQLFTFYFFREIFVKHFPLLSYQTTYFCEFSERKWSKCEKDWVQIFPTFYLIAFAFISFRYLNKKLFLIIKPGKDEFLGT